MADVMRPLLPRALVLMAIAFSCMQAAAREETKTAVADLRYGVALYHYYQQDYLAALSELMVADARDGIQGHGDNPELIAGGVSLAFGMQHHAEGVFTDILQDNRRPQAVRDAAWFYLGKLHYTRANWDAAEQSFARVSGDFKPNLLAQMHALQINIQIRKKNFSTYTVDKIDGDELLSWNPYVLYNLGAAHARDGDFNTAQEYFRKLDDVKVDKNPLRRKEQWALQDKAYTAMGYSFLAQKSYSAAIGEFTKVRLDGAQANQALLGYGWAAVAQEEYAKALQPWQLLRTRSLMYPAVQESLLALPFAYEKLGAKGDALAAYQTAQELLEREIHLIRDMRATLTEGELLTLVGSEPVSAEELKTQAQDKDLPPGNLTAVVADDGQNWLKLDKTSIIKTRSAYLAELFSQNAFQTAVLDLRDLLRLQKLMQQWQPKLDVYRALLLEKQASRSRNEQQLAQASATQKYPALLAERDRLQALIQTIEAEENYIALADDKTRSLYASVERARATIGKMKAAGQDTREQEARVRMFGGILWWNAAQTHPANLYTLQDKLTTANKNLAAVAAANARIADITATSLDIQPTLARLLNAEKEVAQQLASTETLVAAQGALLRAQVDQQLATHEHRLGNYLAQSHLAVARLYDAELRKQPE